MVDLHVHSTFSDGTFTPSQLVDYAMEKGLTAFALTDHDTTDGLPEALAYAKKLRDSRDADTADAVSASMDKAQTRDPQSEKRPAVPEIIPGIELSTDENGSEVHVVGLFIDYENREFAEYLNEFLKSRDDRNRKMCGKLREQGFDVTYEAMLKRFPDSVLTRAHFSRFLLEHGYVKSIKEAFDRYLGDRCPCYVPREKITPVRAVELIRKAQGIPILAHPILYHMSDARLNALVNKLKDAGLMGIEAIYSTYSPAEERQIRRLAKEHQLLISGGSDFHGENKPGLDLGIGYGKLFVPDEILDELKFSFFSANPLRPPVVS